MDGWLERMGRRLLSVCGFYISASVWDWGERRKGESLCIVDEERGRYGNGERVK
jgi:hypothetical protein